MMTSSVEPTNYRYESLVDPRTYIRLLQISGIDEARKIPVHCQLTAWAVEAAPAYTAISYTWGDPNLLEFILVDGKMIEVRQNCGHVLRQSWRLKGSDYIWIDAICINQVDNDEKSPQVAMMGSVYQKAVQTLACVGRHKDDSEFLYDMLRRTSHWWNQEANDALCFRFRRAHLWGLLLRNSTKARLLKAFTSFMGRQYFHRVWVYQELVLGRDIIVCCENENVQASTFWRILAVLDQWSWHPRIIMRCSSSDLQQWRDQWAQMNNTLLTAISDESTRSFSLTMTLVSTLQCEESRDRVYGALAVVDWGGLQPIQPDYNMDKFDLALEALQRIGDDPGFSKWLWHVRQIGKSLHITEEPSEKLNDAMEERMVLTSPNHINTDPRVTTSPRESGEILSPTPARFWGTRLLFDNETWEFSPNDGSPSNSWSGFQLKIPFKSGKKSFPRVQKWSEGSPMDSTQADILLPDDAQRQDLMLVPLPFKLAREDWSTDVVFPCLLARGGGHDALRLVGKALVFPGRLWPRIGAWREFWGKDISSATYDVYLDPEDGLLMAQSFDWNPPWVYPAECRHECRELAEKYFETRLCGSQSRSYVIPMASNVR